MKLDTTIIAQTEVIEVRGQKLSLLAEKAIYWHEASFLILTDLHLGKAGHFRKAGIPIPKGVHEADLLCLQQLIDTYCPKAVLMLGDLFHSEINQEWNDFRVFLQNNASLSFILVKGNHDILPEAAYREDNLTLYQEEWCFTPFHFSHHPLENVPTNLYNMAGHVHPGYRLKGRGGQNIKLPSFHFSAEGVLLPAFGRFTGCVHVPKKQGDQVFILIPTPDKSSKVMRV
ncbi:ligase-associated DNA damage response endonuclease PdeM [Catalinimonas niigatensis]|uniref:ligase-associated DNA damage response endonuclease PdeM n=1 Tax=Catalinimonas niigatensis TaxID=1397264 RepID=UPI002665BAE2|nr:ligase-associated DNA damage response endonuclease PdeM [Catalinimonas niigatensis]WPP51302.1 ligase-associated DNA damage response endonuclease PdeM [Catalinimonas niigatensis]